MALEPITRQEKIIAGQDLTPITRMEKFLKQFGGGGGGLPTGGAPYQQLVTDGEGNAKWEDRLCHATERVKVDLLGDRTFWFYKVSDAIPTGDLSDGAHAAVWYSNNPAEVLDVSKLMDGFYMISNSAFVVLYDNFELDNILIPEKGTYFNLANKFNWTSGLALGEATTPEITWDGSTEIVKKLDEKYLQNHTVVFTESESGDITCNISFDDLDYLIFRGAPITGNFVKSRSYTSQIIRFSIIENTNSYLASFYDDSNTLTSVSYNSDGTITKATSGGS